MLDLSKVVTTCFDHNFPKMTKLSFLTTNLHNELEFKDSLDSRIIIHHQTKLKLTDFKSQNDILIMNGPKGSKDHIRGIIDQNAN